MWKCQVVGAILDTKCVDKRKMKWYTAKQHEVCYKKPKKRTGEVDRNIFWENKIVL